MTELPIPPGAAALSPRFAVDQGNGKSEWSLYLGSVLLGKIDERTMKVYG